MEWTFLSKAIDTMFESYTSRQIWDGVVWHIWDGVAHIWDGVALIRKGVATVPGMLWQSLGLSEKIAELGYIILCDFNDLHINV